MKFWNGPPVEVLAKAINQTLDGLSAQVDAFLGQIQGDVLNQTKQDQGTKWMPRCRSLHAVVEAN